MSVTVRNMTEEEFVLFYRWSVHCQAEELMEECGIAREEAVKEAEEEVSQMLPCGLGTPHNHLMTIEREGETAPVGFMWTLHELTGQKKQSFLCDFVIFESARRRGYGAAALALMEKDAAAAGCRESVLFVADRNCAASALYQKCGYQFLRRFNRGKYMIKSI